MRVAAEMKEDEEEVKLSTHFCWVLWQVQVLHALIWGYSRLDQRRSPPPPPNFFFWLQNYFCELVNQNKGSSDSQQLELKHQRAAAAAASSSASSPTCSARCCRSGHHQQTNRQIPSRSFSNVQNQHQGDEHATAAAASCVHPLRRRRRLFPSPDEERHAKNVLLLVGPELRGESASVSISSFLSFCL